MTQDAQTQKVADLWQQLKGVRTGMLVVDDSGQHPQPMSHFADEHTGALWFIAASDSDLVQAIGHGAQASFTASAQSDGFYASLRGTLNVYDNDDKLDEVWSMPAAAWFEKGREDPKVRLLQFVPREAAVWARDASAVMVAISMVRAAMTEGESDPDIGHHHVLTLNEAA